MEINEIELASELAHELMTSNWCGSDSIYIEDTEGCMIYTKKAQEFFKIHHDYYLKLIEKTKI